jgi:general secretion pathway protein G
MQPTTQTRTHARGFSLLELSLVIAIMGILMAVAAFNLIGGANNAKVSATKASMQNIKTAMQQYQVQNNSYPPAIATLIPSSLQTGADLDGWDQPFYYQPTGKPNAPVEQGFTLVSIGADRQPGTEDDMDIWIVLARKAN